MDTNAARKARRAAVKADLRQAYTDEEATPPEWVDLLERAREELPRIKGAVAQETHAFVGEPDIRKALARRDRTSARLRDEIAAYNALIRRLNLIVPSARFTRPALDADEVLKPLFRAPRRPVS